MASEGGARWKALLAFLGGFIGVFALVIACTVGVAGKSSEPSEIPDNPTSRVVMPSRPSGTAATPTHIPAQGAICKEVPARIVEIIDAQFTNGEHLAHAQSVDGTHAETFVGGNIFRGDLKVSSQDTWVLHNGVVYSLTSDARRHSMLRDGRNIATDWSDFSAVVGECVGRLERAANQGS
ncbi:hypothetical protein [Mycobacteroides abscessus]|uniref:hypothetical protein n=1 Tax=Mycobacteroides abscessus TaxID=36809 RepID=UPI002106E5D6|nr:hypothetical protein [Mycobacteroides abscessus]